MFKELGLNCLFSEKLLNRLVLHCLSRVSLFIHLKFYRKALSNDQGYLIVW